MLSWKSIPLPLKYQLWLKVTQGHGAHVSVLTDWQLLKKRNGGGFKKERRAGAEIFVTICKYERPKSRPTLPLSKINSAQVYQNLNDYSQQYCFLDDEIELKVLLGPESYFLIISEDFPERAGVVECIVEVEGVPQTRPHYSAPPTRVARCHGSPEKWQAEFCC